MQHAVWKRWSSRAVCYAGVRQRCHTARNDHVSEAPALKRRRFSAQEDMWKGQSDPGQHPSRVTKRPAISEIDDDHSMIRKSPPSIGEELRCRKVGWHPGADESVDDHQVGVPVTHACEATATVGAAHFDPATSGQWQVAADKGGELDVRAGHDLR